MGLGAVHDNVCQDTGSAAPSGNRAFAQQPAPAHTKQRAVQKLTPQQKQWKQQRVPENMARPCLWKCEFPTCFHRELHFLCPACITTALRQPCLLPFLPTLFTLLASQCSAIQHQSESCCNSLYYSPAATRLHTLPKELTRCLWTLSCQDQAINRAVPSYPGSSFLKCWCTS